MTMETPSKIANVRKLTPRYLEHHAHPWHQGGPPTRQAETPRKTPGEKVMSWHLFGGVLNSGFPSHGWFIMENPNSTGWFGGTPIWGNHHIPTKYGDFTGFHVSNWFVERKFYTWMGWWRISYSGMDLLVVLMCLLFYAVSIWLEMIASDNHWSCGPTLTRNSRMSAGQVPPLPHLKFILHQVQFHLISG